jgi:hypothetical protein
MSKSYDFAKRAAQRIDLELERAHQEREALRIAALQEDPDTTDFAKNCERRIAEAILEEQIAETARKEETLLEDERSNQ